MESSNFAHSKVAEEKENSGVEAAHKTEQSGGRCLPLFQRALQRENGKTESESCKSWRKADAERVNFRYQVLGRKSEMQEKDHSEAVAEKDCKSSVSNRNMQKQDGGTDSEKAAKETAANRESFTAAAERYRRL